MHLDDILKLDIKLLVAFVTIMEEGSVSRAAERLNVTQPALSKSLQRLRELFKDSLFTRQALWVNAHGKSIRVARFDSTHFELFIRTHEPQFSGFKNPR